MSTKSLSRRYCKTAADAVNKLYDSIPPAHWRHLRAHKRIKKLVWRARWV